MTARINIVHKLYDRKGNVSGYMVKDGHGTPGEYRVYDAEGDFLYGLVDRQPWTVFRILDRDGRLTYVGLTRSKHLRKRLEPLGVKAQYLTPSLLGAILGEEEYPTRRGTLIAKEYPNRQQAEDAEKRYVRQMFPKSKYGLSTPRRRKFGPHKGTRRYIVNPQAPGKRKGKAYIQRPPSKQYIHKAHTAIIGDVNEALGWRPGHPRVNDQLALFSGYYRTRDTLTWMFKSPEQRRREELEDERKQKPKHQRKTVVMALWPHRWKKGHRFERCVYCSGKRPWRSKWPGSAQLRLFDDEPFRSSSCPGIFGRPSPSRKGEGARRPAKVGGFRWGKLMGQRDSYSLKAPDVVHLPNKLVDPRVRTKAIAAAEAIRSVKDGRKEAPAPMLVSSVFGNEATYYIGSWGALKRDETRQVGPSEGKYEGLNEILAEVDGERLEHDIVTDPRLLRQLEEDPAFNTSWEEHWANKAVDAVDDDPPALPWTEAYRYVGQMLEREKLTKEERFAIALQLSNLVKRLRQRGTLEWIEVDKLPDEKVPKADLITQNKVAELCGVSVRTIKSLENIYEKPEPPTKRTLQKIYGGLRSIARDGVDRWQDNGLPTEPYSKDRLLTNTFVTDMTPQQYAATLSEVPTDGLKPLSKDMEWIIAVRVGQEIITLNLDTLYRERINTAPKESEVKRDGILMGLARKRYGSWDDLAQAAFLGLWKDAGHKHPDSTDGRRKDAPLEYSLFIRDPKIPEELKPVFPGETDPVFEAWAWKRGDSPSRSERRRDTTYRQRQKSVGEEWKLALLQTSSEITWAKADHNAAYLGGKKPIWNARHVVLLDMAKSHVRAIPVALKWAAAAKVLRVVLVVLQHADPRRKLVTCVQGWPLFGYAPPERLARIGETRRLYPIRRRHLLANGGDGLPQKPDDFQSLGPYPFGKRTLLDNVVYPVAGFVFDHGKLISHGAQKPIDVENEVWPGDPLKDLEKLYKYKKLADERSAPRRAAELDRIKGVDQVTLGEATEDSWNPQRKGIDAAWDPEDDHGDLQEEAPSAKPADEL